MTRRRLEELLDISAQEGFTLSSANDPYTVDDDYIYWELSGRKRSVSIKISCINMDFGAQPTGIDDIAFFEVDKEHEFSFDRLNSDDWKKTLKKFRFIMKSKNWD